jgi:hypothetical protein
MPGLLRSPHTDLAVRRLEGLDTSFSRIWIEQSHNTEVLHGNLLFFFGVLIWVSIEGVNCLGTAGELLQHGLGDRIEELKNRGLAVFEKGR